MAEEIGLLAIFDVNQFNKGLSQYTSGVNLAETSTDLAAKSISGIGDVAKIAFGTVLGNVATAAAGAVVGAMQSIAGSIVDIGKESFNLAVDFESAMTTLSLAVGSTGPSFQDLKDAALAVGGASNLVGVSASDAAQAMESLYKAGLTTEQVLGDLNATMEDGNNVTGALRASIDLAAATTLDMTQAADLASKVIGIFGDDAEKAGKSVDVWIVDAMDNLVRAADASVAEVEGLAEALKFVGPTASQAGLSLEDTNTALAILSKSGIEASMAGTNLRAMLISLLSPTDQAEKHLKQLGVSMFDSTGAARPFEDVARDLTQALYGMNDATVIVGGRTKEQNKLLEDAQKRYKQLTDRVNKHNAGLVIMSDKALEKVNAEMTNATNIIAELSGIQGEATTTTRQLTDAQREEAINAIFTANGAAAYKAIAAEVNKTNEEGVDGWEAMTRAIAGATGMQAQAEAKAATFAGKMEALDGVIETLKISLGDKFLPAITDLVSVFTTIVETVGPGVIDTIGNMIAPVEDAIEPLGKVATAFSRLISPATEESLDGMDERMARIAGASDVVIDKADDFRQAIIEFGIPPEVVSSVEEFWKIASKIPDVTDAFVELFGKVTKGSVGFGTILNFRTVINDAFGSETGSKITAFTEEFVKVFLKIQKTIQGAIPIIRKKISDIASAISEVVAIAQPKIAVIISAFQEFFAIIGERIVPKFMKLLETLGLSVEESGGSWDFLKGVIEIAFIAIEAVIISALVFISGALSGIIGFLQVFAENFGNIIGGIKIVFSGLADVFIGVGEVLANLIKGDFSAAFKAGDKVLQGFAKMFIGVGITIGSVINAMVLGVIKGVKEFVKTILIFISDMADKLVGHSIIPDMVEAIIEWFQTLFDIGSQLIDDLRAFIEQTWQNILDAIPGWWAQITDAIFSAISAIPGAVSAAVDTVIEIGLSIVNKIREGIEQIWDTIVTAIDTAIRALPESMLSAIATVIKIGVDIAKKIAEGISNAWNSAVNTAIQGSIQALNLAGGTIDALKKFGGSIVDQIKNGVSDAWDNVTTIINNLVSTGLSLGQTAIDSLKQLGIDIIGYITDSLLGDTSFAGALRQVVVSGINDIIDKINEFIDWANDTLPGTDFPHVPTLAAGVMNFSGGMAMVGEQGPEIVTLPRGSNVIPLNSPIGSTSITSNSVINNIFNLNMSGDFSSGDIATDTGAAMREIQVAAMLRL